MNKITKLNTLISVCLNRGTGVNGILEKLKEAANGVYKPKQWDQTDKDLGILVMNIGGPSLIKAFSSLNMLPSSSYMYKVGLKNLAKLIFNFND
jgi:hypothetical protein